ncbi:MAG: BON domain-containing protein [Proteobacteria bacterium]|nr:MAG: BON domain-containing protein [Pseudomonadota bacterium]
MKKKLIRLSLLSVVCLNMFGCTALVVGGVAAGATSGAAVASDPRSSDGVFDDQSLRRKVDDAINATVPGNNVEVTSYNQSILLTGQVISPDNKAKSETMALQVPGVKKVYNYIEIGKSQSASQTSKDAYLTSAIKSNLLFSKGVSSNDVKVVTTNGVVYLMGMVDPYQAKRMAKAASEIDGVKSVVTLFEYSTN